MDFHLLAVGDVVADGGLDCLRRHLRPLQKTYDVHFTVVNGENAAGIGVLPGQAHGEMFDAGADVVTLGNHTWTRPPAAQQTGAVLFTIDTRARGGAARSRVTGRTPRP